MEWKTIQLLIVTELPIYVQAESKGKTCFHLAEAKPSIGFIPI